MTKIDFLSFPAEVNEITRGPFSMDRLQPSWGVLWYIMFTWAKGHGE